MRPNRTTVSCRQCGKAFSVKVSRIAVGKGKFCSKDCYLLAVQQTPSPQRNRINCICQQCGSKFATIPSKIDRKYCSRKCRGIAETTRTPQVCQHCGAPFTAEPNQLKRGKRFCSHACYAASRKVPATTRFWAKVEKTETCWLWRGAINSTGYGAFDGTSAHRFSYELTYGPVPDDLFVCHRCDTPACVRPDHLFAGTQKENLEDMVEKGRSLIGSRHHRTKLTEDQVRDIRQRRANGESLTDLAHEFGVGTPCIWSICDRRTWKHV